jgi:hypothetical protein
LPDGRENEDVMTKRVDGNRFSRKITLGRRINPNVTSSQLAREPACAAGVSEAGFA